MLNFLVKSQDSQELFQENPKILKNFLRKSQDSRNYLITPQDTSDSFKLLGLEEREHEAEVFLPGGGRARMPKIVSNTTRACMNARARVIHHHRNP